MCVCSPSFPLLVDGDASHDDDDKFHREDHAGAGFSCVAEWDFQWVVAGIVVSPTATVHTTNVGKFFQPVCCLRSIVFIAETIFHDCSNFQAPIFCVDVPLLLPFSSSSSTSSSSPSTTAASLRSCVACWLVRMMWTLPRSHKRISLYRWMNKRNIYANRWAERALLQMPPRTTVCLLCECVASALAQQRMWSCDYNI